MTSDVWTRDFAEPAQKRGLAQEVMTYIDLASTSGISWTQAGGDLYELAQTNPVAARCVDKIAGKCMAIPIEVYVGDKVQENHPLDLILNGTPRPGQSGAQNKYAMAALLSSAGECYVNGTITPKGLTEILQVLGPTGWTPAYDDNGILLGYDFQSGKGKKSYRFDRAGKIPVKRLGVQKPGDPKKTVSRAAMASKAIDENNENRAYTKGMFSRFGRRPAVAILPSGAGAPDKTQVEEAKKRIEHHYTTDPEGKLPLFVSGGVTYQELGSSASDMQALDHRSATAREICFIFGVPPMLMGIQGDQTYANQKEANASLDRDTIRPLMDLVCAELTEWLSPMYPGIELRADYSGDAYSAYEAEMKWERVAKADGLCVDEKRDLMGYGPVSEITDDGDGSVVFVSGTVVPLSEAVSPVLDPMTTPAVPAPNAQPQ